MLFIVTSSFESVLVFSGFILGLSSLTTVLGVFVLRHRQGDGRKDGDTGYRTWAYPLPPLIYSTIMVWTLTFITVNRPVEAGVAGIIIVLGFFSYLLTEKLSRAQENPPTH